MNARVSMLVVALALFVTACAEHELAGFVRDPAPSVAGEALPDVSADGTIFPFRAESGGILVVYFGYTSCPDICPTTLADLRIALSEIGDDAEHVTFAMATIDPTRDTDEVITGYVQGFIPSGHALRTEDDGVLSAAVAAFGGRYSVDPDVEGEYVVTHTGSLYAVDDEGTLIVTWPFGVTSDDLASDLEFLVGRA